MSLNIQGLQKLTLLDYPGKLACTVFLGACNFRCPFCQNGSLVRKGGRPQEPIPEEEILSFLKKRQGLLDGVCVTGGEPLLQNLAPFLRAIKDLGYLVKLDSNGSRPEALEALLAAGLVDRVAMDIKNLPEAYAETVGLDEVDLGAIETSIAHLEAFDGELEFRTTVCQELHPPETILALGARFAPKAPYVLQNYREEGDILCPGWTPYAKDELQALVAQIGYGAELRGDS